MNVNFFANMSTILELWQRVGRVVSSESVRGKSRDVASSDVQGA